MLLRLRTSLFLLLLPVLAGRAQPQPLALTLDEALQIALVHNYALRSARLDVATADAQVKEGWGLLYPQVDFNSGYTRNVVSANPFAGSQAGGLFQTLGFLDWLAYNEEARTDDDGTTSPLSLDDFFDRQQQGLDEAGIVQDAGSNPFAVPNQFQNGLTISQTVFDARALWGAQGASKYLRTFNERAADRQEQLVIGQVKQAFYGTLLAEELARVSSQSVERTRETADEMGRRVAQGTAPKFQRLSAEVELANLETRLVQAQTDALRALDNLKLLLGIPVEQPLRLRGTLEPGDTATFMNIAAEGAVDLALRQRPDVAQARIGVELEQVRTKAARADYLPTANVFANISHLGNVPSNRVNILTDPDDPFKFSRQTNSFFSGNYWDWSVNVGFQLRWNLFNGFQTRYRMQQRHIAQSKAALQYEQLEQSVRLEVQQALRDLASAQQRLSSQERNIERAMLNYDFAVARLREGVASPLEVRDASEQLDMSRWNHAQAIHDWLLARTAFETAIGIRLTPTEGGQLTRN